MTSNPSTPDIPAPPIGTVRAGRHRAGPPPAGPWRRRGARAAAVGCFTAAAALANTATDHHPLIPVGFGLHATTATLAVGIIALHNTWLREVGGQRLVFAAIAAATLASTCAAGLFGAGWGIAYLVAELVGLCTWRPLRHLGHLDSHDPRLVGAVLLTSLIEATVYVALISSLVPASVGGQMLGKAEAALGTAAIGLSIQAAWRRATRAGRHG